MALTEEQLEVLGDRLVPLFQQLERAVLGDIARRLVKTGRLTETAEIMAETLRDKGFSPSEIRAQVMKMIGADKRIQDEIAANTLAMKQVVAGEIKAMRENVRIEAEGLWEDAGNMAFREDLAVWESGAKPVRGAAFDKLIDATAKRATDELLNLTKTTGFRTATGALIRAQQAYTREANLAFAKMATGAYSYGQAVEEAVRELAQSGLRTVDYESGVSRQLDTAVRNAVMTASSQLAGEITMQNVEQTGVECVEVSAHWGAREGAGHANHAAWQGKVYRVQGEDSEYGNLEKATGYPSDPAGLCGYNCRHTFYPFWPGISEPTEWAPEPGPFDVDGRTYTYYQATQAQRRREREIRALKREEAAFEAAGLKDQAKEAARKIRIKTVEYKDFSEAVGIRAKTERLRVCEGTKAAIKSLNLAKKHDIILPSSTMGGSDMQVICKIDKDIYSCVADDIVSEDVVLRAERIGHIQDHHPDDYERYGQYIREMIEEPDYIIETARPKTAFVLKSFEVDEQQFRLILRLHTTTDDPKFENSVITFQYVRAKEYRRLIKNKKVLYKRNGL